MIEIINPEGGTVMVHPTDESYTQHSLQSCGELSLSFSLPEYVEFKVGSYCKLPDGTRYTLTQPENITMQHSHNYQYTLLMYDPGYLLGDFKFRNTRDGRLAFSLTSRSHEFLEEIVENLNERTYTEDSKISIKWVVGEYIDSVEHLMSFSYNTINEALQMIADEFETEWEIIPQADGSTYSINLRKVEYNKDNPVSLSYGQGNGFLPGVKRNNDGSAREIYRMYVQGGDRNLPVSQYDGGRLKLPVEQPEIEYPATIRNGDTVEEPVIYKVSEDRNYIYNKKKGDKGYEETINCEHIYPSYIGNVTKLEKEGKFYDIIDSNIPYSTKFKSADNDKMRIVFQSGELAGKEFDVSAFESSYDKNDPKKYIGGRFKLCNQNIDGVEMPSGIYVPAEASGDFKGDKYIVFGCELPSYFITDAENRMFKEAARLMHENEYPRFSLTGELDSIFLRSKGADYISKNIVTGGYISFVSPFTGGTEGELIRITGVKRNLNNRYKIDLSLSNASPGVSFTNTINKIKGQEVIISDNQKEVIRYAKRRYRDAIETQNMLKDALLKDFTESVSPITVQTMQMIAGGTQLQFDFVNANTGAVEEFRGEWNISKRKYSIPESAIKHYTFGQENIMQPGAESTLFRIDEPFERTIEGEDAGKPFYLYIIHNSGTVDEKGVKLAYYDLKPESHNYSEDGKYYFLVGILSSENEGDRLLTKLYGFTEITPGCITTDLLRSQDGKSSINLKENEMRLSSEKNNGSSLTWQNGELEVTGKIKQISGDGGTYDVGVYKGEYKDDITYYPGDDVYYIQYGETCTYRCKEKSTGNKPEDSNYWRIIARGAKGDAGTPGKNGAPIVFRGDWKKENEYYGTPERLDVVQCGPTDNPTYYITKITSGTIPPYSTEPDKEAGEEQDKKWTSFGAQFESVATGMLISKKANIGGWYIVDNKLGSQNDKIYLDGNTEQIILADQISLDNEGLKLYKDTNPQKKEADIRAQIRIKDIESYEDMGIGTIDKTPELDKRKSNTVTLYGFHSGYDPAPAILESGNLWTKDLVAIAPNSKSRFNNLKTEIKITFTEISSDAYHQGFSPDKIKIIPIINGEEISGSFKYYPDVITLPVKGPYSVSAQLDFGSFDSSVTGINANIGFKTVMEYFSGPGTAKCFCEFTPTIENVKFETESEIKTIIAPNGFYCYGGNKNLLWVTPEKVQIKGGAGPVISSGKYALKVSSEGISKSCNFTENENLIKWEPVFTEDSQILSTGNYALKVGSNGLYISKNYTSNTPSWKKVRLIDESNTII